MKLSDIVVCPVGTLQDVELLSDFFVEPVTHR